MNCSSATPTVKILNANVIVAALGYFVDIYDLLLFSIVRVASLKSIGIADSQLMDQGVFLINAQMLGMLLGGIVWGVIGDKRGRLSVLFGSILMYSLANIANAFATNVPTYALLRFIAGVGLAGELGAAITLVSETMSAETRGYGTAIVAAVGILGAVAAAVVGEMMSWQSAFIVGGVMGLGLLVLRVSMFESGLFARSSARDDVRRGDLRMLFSSASRFTRYARCVLIGIPVWYIVGILVTFSPELAKALGATEPIGAGKAILFAYAGLAVGDLGSGFLSQYLKSRRRVVGGFLALSCVFIAWYFAFPPRTSAGFYTLCMALGFGAGYWAVFATVAAEQFGTNLRATVATTVPNFVRGAVVPITLAFSWLKAPLGLAGSAIAVGVVTLSIAFAAWAGMSETYGIDLDYFED